MGIFANLSANRKIIGRLQALEEAVEGLPKLKRDLQSLDLEFTNLFGKVRTALGRIEKRAAIIENEQGSAEEEEVGADPSLPAGLDLTPEQLKWQKRIQAERRRA